ncbi:hypothetical protein FA09DRAFT_330181 [Tilletiopsis washingtonensis]|uniref:ZC3H15/TMA46 family C-terminal domain-containing protein n=1 Tax=Tilletiopsis washingtonensis TaxID=58919 RepID=A0A316ZAS1_9BASI|nr:hypothetical protein FA09DRAFT_330181 [Tilletiopsis washingtonensis]PWN98022.1 hypothetical protein FA09DRAFT_330181 [Tilletiopsis washingtonensis]
MAKITGGQRTQRAPAGESIEHACAVSETGRAPYEDASLVREAKRRFRHERGFGAVQSADGDNCLAAQHVRPPSTSQPLISFHQAEESLGMAMVFTLASHLRDALTNYLQREKEAKAAEEARRRDAEIEAEAEKFRGTAVTPERFAAWRVAFEKEMAAAAAKAEEERIRREYKTAKEREEYRKLQQRPTGKELFQKGGLHSDKSLDHDDEAGAEGEELDLSQFGSREEREKLRREEVEKEEREREQKLREGLESDEE